MRDRQPLGLDHAIAPEQNVDINGPRSPSLVPRPLALLLDIGDQVEKLEGRQPRRYFGYAV